MMQRPKAEDDFEREFLAVIDRYGWHINMVGADDEGPSFLYSTGIFERTGKAELIVFSLPLQVGQWVVNDYGKRVLAGEIFEPRGLYDDFLDGHKVTFLPVTQRIAVEEYVTWTDWYYRRQPFPLFQLIYPDSQSGAFPWQEGYRESWRPLQPILGAPMM